MWSFWLWLNVKFLKRCDQKFNIKVSSYNSTLYPLVHIMFIHFSLSVASFHASSHDFHPLTLSFYGASPGGDGLSNKNSIMILVECTHFIRETNSTNYY